MENRLGWETGLTVRRVRGTWLVQLEEHETVDLRVVS